MTSLRDELTAAVSLPDFLSTHEVGTLSIDDRRLIVQQALLLLEQNYAHLPFKVARYGINPLQRLRLMQARLGRSGDPGPEVSFHAEMVDIYNSLHDLHTRYTLPRPFNAAVAFLPFLVKEFTEDGRRRSTPRTGSTSRACRSPGCAPRCSHRSSSRRRRPASRLWPVRRASA